jgi:hypothetical protein
MIVILRPETKKPSCWATLVEALSDHDIVTGEDAFLLDDSEALSVDDIAREDQVLLDGDDVVSDGEFEIDGSNSASDNSQTLPTDIQGLFQYDSDDSDPGTQGNLPPPPVAMRLLVRPYLR